jgi:hypothetical protein
MRRAGVAPRWYIVADLANPNNISLRTSCVVVIMDTEVEDAAGIGNDWGRRQLGEDETYVVRAWERGPPPVDPFRPCAVGYNASPGDRKAPASLPTPRLLCCTPHPFSLCVYARACVCTRAFPHACSHHLLCKRLGLWPTMASRLSCA